jgi:hypothetical protein
MIEFWIADLMSKENKFSIPASAGTWKFVSKTLGTLVQIQLDFGEDEE